MKVDEVKRFFNRTDLYLHKRYGIMLRRDLIKELTSSHSFKNVLDIGCGDGSLVLDFVEDADHVSLIDLSDNMLSLAKLNIESSLQNKIPEVKYFNSDFISFETTRKFDLILLVGVLAHIPDLDSVFKKLRNLVNEDGRIIIQYSDASHFMIKIRHMLHSMYSKYSLNLIKGKLILELCLENDFLIVATTRFNFPFFGMRFLSDTALYRFQHWLVRQNWLSFLLSDAMIVLKRNPSKL